jgi:spore germination cell wall hydrolase CwlJ-like protein
MTTTTLATVDRNAELARTFSRVFMIALMLIGIYASGSLLKWAVTNKLDNINTAAASNVTAELRERQLACLAKNIYYEAGHEPFEGKVAVAQVTLNRTKSGQFPEDVCQTIYQKNVVYSKVICQFSWACDRETGVRPINKAAYNESMEVAKKVLLEGFRLPSLTNALYYHADYINPGWNRQKIAHIGRHIFYR